MKRILLGMMLLGLISVVVGCSNQAKGKSQVPSYTLRVGITQNDVNAEYLGLLKFKEVVEEQTNGDVLVETYHSGQLASVPDLVEQASVGASVGTISDAAMLGDMEQVFYMLQAPYVFKDQIEIQKLLDSELFDGWVNDFSEKGLRILSFNFLLGERNIATIKPVLESDDIHGNVIRTNGSQIVDQSVAAMGASPSGMPWTEAYAGLQQGVIDGVEAHNLAIYESSLYEVINHIAKTNHYSLVSALVVSEKWFDKLPETYLDIVLDAANEAGILASELAEKQSIEYEELMIEQGVEFHEIDTEPFRELTKNVFSRLGLEKTREDVLRILEE